MDDTTDVQLVSAQEVAAQSGVSTSTVHRRARNGAYPGAVYEWGPTRRFDLAAILRQGQKDQATSTPASAAKSQPKVVERQRTSHQQVPTDSFEERRRNLRDQLFGESEA